MRFGTLGSPLTIYTRDHEAAQRFAVAAELLGLGWRLRGYDAPISDNETVREFEFTFWAEQRSDVAWTWTT